MNYSNHRVFSPSRLRSISTRSPGLTLGSTRSSAPARTFSPSICLPSVSCLTTHRAASTAALVDSSRTPFPSSTLPSSLLTTSLSRSFVTDVNAAQAAKHQKWSTVTLISLATLIGSLTYLMGVSSSSEEDEYKPPSKKGFQKALSELKKILPEDCVSTDEEILKGHSASPWNHHLVASLHGVVVYPRSTQDVVEIVKIASANHIPITPFSGGTSIEGAFDGPSNKVSKASGSHSPTIFSPPPTPPTTAPSICLSFESMDAILSIHAEDGDVVVQPGVGYVELNEELKQRGTGLFFPVDPGPGAMIGGMIGTGCSGTNAVRYGTMRENVLNLTVVLANGEVIKTRQRAKKSSAGPDLGRLFIGSEGILGIITEATIKLAPILPTSVASCSFPTVQHATDAVSAIVHNGIQVQCVELLDEVMLQAVNKTNEGKKQWEEKPSLFIKFAGTEAQIQSDIAQTGLIVKQNEGNDFVFAKNEEEKASIWEARKLAFFSAIAFVDNARQYVTDVCVPISNLSRLVQDTKEDMIHSGLIAPFLGHVGDGNFHACIAVRDDEELSRAKGAVDRMVKRAIELDGTCTGEHGVGIGKREYLERELGAGTVKLLRNIKKEIDPRNIMNPGKVLPDS